MLIKPANLSSALTHIREALSTLSTLNRDERGCFHDHITEQLTEAETLLSSDMEEPETNEPNERERGVIFTYTTEPVKTKHFSFRGARMSITEVKPANSRLQEPGAYVIAGMGVKATGDMAIFVMVDGNGKIGNDYRRIAYNRLKEAKSIILQNLIHQSKWNN